MIVFSTQRSSNFRGSSFYFVSAAHRDAFAAEPSKYAPQYGGYCAYGMAKGYKATMDPEALRLWATNFTSTYSEAVRSRWLQDIPGYLQKGDANWPDIKNVVSHPRTIPSCHSFGSSTSMVKVIIWRLLT